MGITSFDSYRVKIAWVPVIAEVWVWAFWKLTAPCGLTGFSISEPRQHGFSEHGHGVQALWSGQAASGRGWGWRGRPGQCSLKFISAERCFIDYALLLFAVGSVFCVFRGFFFFNIFAVGVFAIYWHILKACHVSLITDSQKKADFCYCKIFISTWWSSEFHL